jgi:hypothetical protein
MKGKLMDDFNWVEARCECSPGQIFEKLKSQVQSDVAEREASLTQVQKARYRFSFIPGGNAFHVSVDGEGNIHSTVKFGITDTGVVVFNDQGKIMFGADVTISDKGECKLEVDGEEKELWQVRKMALEKLLFGKY